MTTNQRELPFMVNMAVENGKILEAGRRIFGPMEAAGYDDLEVEAVGLTEAAREVSWRQQGVDNPSRRYTQPARLERGTDRHSDQLARRPDAYERSRSVSMYPPKSSYSPYYDGLARAPLGWGDFICTLNEIPGNRGCVV